MALNESHHHNVKEQKKRQLSGWSATPKHAEIAKLPLEKWPTNPKLVGYGWMATKWVANHPSLWRGGYKLLRAVSLSQHIGGDRLPPKQLTVVKPCFGIVRLSSYLEGDGGEGGQPLSRQLKWGTLLSLSYVMNNWDWKNCRDLNPFCHDYYRIDRWWQPYVLLAVDWQSHYIFL